MRIYRAADHTRMPWKNGGGFTTEIVVSPPRAPLHAFDWRVSMADVATSGPFSLFPGIDRTLLVLTGHGMRLDIEGRAPVTLTPLSAPLSFPADVATTASLVDGPVTDLNVMSVRGRFVHTVERLDAPRRGVGAPDQVRPDQVRLVLVAAGHAMVEGGVSLSPRDAAVFDVGEAMDISPGDARAAIWLVSIFPVRSTTLNAGRQ